MKGLILIGVVVGGFAYLLAGSLTGLLVGLFLVALFAGFLILTDGIISGSAVLSGVVKILAVVLAVLAILSMFS